MYTCKTKEIAMKNIGVKVQITHVGGGGDDHHMRSLLARATTAES